MWLLAVLKLTGWLSHSISWWSLSRLRKWSAVFFAFLNYTQTLTWLVRSWILSVENQTNIYNVSEGDVNKTNFRAMNTFTYLPILYKIMSNVTSSNWLGESKRTQKPFYEVTILKLFSGLLSKCELDQYLHVNINTNFQIHSQSWDPKFYKKWNNLWKYVNKYSYSCN